MIIIYCFYGNEPLDGLQFGEFLDQLRILLHGVSWLSDESRNRILKQLSTSPLSSEFHIRLYCTIQFSTLPILKRHKRVSAFFFELEVCCAFFGGLLQFALYEFF